MNDLWKVTKMLIKNKNNENITMANSKYFLNTLQQ